MGHSLRLLPFLTLAAMAVPAVAQPGATARLVACGGGGDCLLVHGRRGSPEAVVRLNDRPVAVEGGKAWRVTLPVATVREWSAPHARTLHVAVIEPGATVGRDIAARLPVGMLGRPVELASLIVRVR